MAEATELEVAKISDYMFSTVFLGELAEERLSDLKAQRLAASVQIAENKDMPRSGKDAILDHLNELNEDIARVTIHLKNVTDMVIVFSDAMGEEPGRPSKAESKENSHKMRCMGFCNDLLKQKLKGLREKKLEQIALLERTPGAYKPDVERRIQEIADSIEDVEAKQPNAIEAMRFVMTWMVLGRRPIRKEEEPGAAAEKNVLVCERETKVEEVALLKQEKEEEKKEDGPPAEVPRQVPDAGEGAGVVPAAAGCGTGA